MEELTDRPVALVTGVSRKIGIGAAIEGEWINGQLVYSNGGVR